MQNIQVNNTLFLQKEINNQRKCIRKNISVWDKNGKKVQNPSISSVESFPQKHISIFVNVQCTLIICKAIVKELIYKAITFYTSISYEKARILEKLLPAWLLLLDLK